MEIKKLNERPDLISVIATWWFNEWSHLSANPSTAAAAVKALRDELNKNESLPHILIAIEDGKVVGTAALKLHELHKHFPETRYWLGNVYVKQAARGAGIASALVREVESVAVAMNIPTLHLQTESLDGGLYKHLGWQPMTKVGGRGGEVLVMNKQLINSVTLL